MNHVEFNIPILDWPSDAGGANRVQVDSSDPRFRDPLVRLSEVGVASESFYARTDKRNSPYNMRIEGSLSQVWCRGLVAKMLQKANALLWQYDTEIFVWDGYRPIETQLGLWSFFWNKSLELMPTATAEQRRAWMLRYVSDPEHFSPVDSTSWPAHSTGGAVDLTLRSRSTHQLLDMGSAFDEMTELSHSDALERMFRDGKIDEDVPALRHRRLLHWAMQRSGFANYPFEFWHFDWGNQMYVKHFEILGRPVGKSAWFGYAESPV
tara:strand:- start:11075 stop:11869 length:795 start_codon:yes stop_codon:yes gene_type:complete